MEKLTFDRKYRCDWCSEKKSVSVCHYGTTNYNRLVCLDCAKKINRYHKNIGDDLVFELPEENDIIS